MRGIINIVYALHARGVRLPPRLTLAEQAELLAGRKLKQQKRQAEPESPYPWATPGRTVALVLPGYLPTSLNKWGRDRKERSRAVAEALDVLIACYPELLKAPEVRSDHLKTFWRPRFRLAMWFPTNRDRDPGNYDKSVKDALVRCKLIRGDSARIILLEPEHFDVDPVNPRTEVTLTERGPAERR